MEKVTFVVVCAMLAFQAPVRALADDKPTPANFDPFKEAPAEFDARAQPHFALEFGRAGQQPQPQFEREMMVVARTGFEIRAAGLVTRWF